MTYEPCGDEGCIFALLHPERPKHYHTTPLGVCWKDAEPCAPTCGHWSGCRHERVGAA